MTDPIETTKEAAKATQEVAKTAGKVVDASRELGSFIARYVSGSIEQASGMVEDKLRYMRWERQVRLMQRAEAFRKAEGIEHLQPIPMKLAIPLFQAASLEEDDSLQDAWARLLVNAANPANQVEVNRSLITILENLTPFDASILDTLYRLPFKQVQHNGIWTALLPAQGIPGTEDGGPPDLVKDLEPSDRVVLALANLKRLGCISSGGTWGGGETFARVTPTLMGKHFVEACSLASN